MPHLTGSGSKALRSLANGFKSLANDIYQFFAPALSDVGEILTSLMNGDFNGAWTAAKRLAMRPVNFVADQVQNVVERVSGAADVATNHTPGAEGTAQAAARNATRAARGALFGSGQTRGAVRLTAQDIIDIKKVAATEVVGSLKGEAFDKQLAGVVDTILNRVYQKGGNVRAVLNERWAFSDINAPRKGAYGSVQNVPMSRVSARISKGVDDHLAKRAAGMASVVGGNTHYANPYFLGEASARTRRWVRDVERQANATGQRFGAGRAVHVHGTPAGSAPSPAFKVILGGNQAVAAGAQRGLQSMRQGAAARQQAQQITNNSNMQLAINAMEDASAAARNRLVQIVPAMV